MELLRDRWGVPHVFAGTDGGTILSQMAQSYTQFVRLDEVDESMSILPIGQSEHPDSPYRLSNYDLWGQGQLHPAPLTRQAVDTLATSGETLPLTPE